MSYRISRRTRPLVSGYPWPFLTNVDAISRTDFDLIRPSYDTPTQKNFLGGFTFPAIMELLYGVKKFNVVASFSGDAGATVGSINVDIVSKLSYSPYSASNELTNFENTPGANGDSCWFEAATGDPLIGNTILAPVHRSSYAGYPAPYGVDAEIPTGLNPPLDIIHVNNPGASDFYMDGMFFTNLFDGGGPATGDITSFCSLVADPAELPFNAFIVLSGSTSFTIRCSAFSPFVTTMDSASCTITATEWHAYQTTAGLPAFDSTTGLPINGGPGA